MHYGTSFRDQLPRRIAHFEEILKHHNKNSQEWTILAHARKEWSHNQSISNAQCDIDLHRLARILSSNKYNSAQ